MSQILKRLASQVPTLFAGPPQEGQGNHLMRAFAAMKTQFQRLDTALAQAPRAMIAEELRQSILTLHSQGRALRDISRILKVSRNTVRRMLRHREPRSRQNHPKHPAIGPQLAEIYRRCRGNGVRIQEILKDEHGIEVRRAP